MQRLESLVHPLSEPVAAVIPEHFVDPFTTQPHPLARLAASVFIENFCKSSLFQSLHKAGEGKMFGVLVVIDQRQRIGYLQAFSGMLDNNWIIDGFVPPLFDLTQFEQLLEQSNAAIELLNQQIESLKNSDASQQLETRLQQAEQHSAQQQKQLRLTRLNRRRHRHHLRSLATSLPEDAQTRQMLASLDQQSSSDKRLYKNSLKQLTDSVQQVLKEYDQKIRTPLARLKHQRKQLSSLAQQQLFSLYQLYSPEGQVTPLTHCFADQTPPSGSGDCAAPKLLQYANQNALKPLALAEFWLGPDSQQSVRKHGQFYPPCRGRCRKILPGLLDSKLGEIKQWTDFDKPPEIIFCDKDLLVVEKPAGMLSVRGLASIPSVEAFLEQTVEGGAKLVHRLDMSTSGLLIAARSQRSYRKLQQQFIKRSIKKRYLALLSGVLPQPYPRTIELPLCTEINDRPRQMVSFEHGKPALTKLKIVAIENGLTRVAFFPVTGRTHQLRVHAAHPLGLNLPIMGDTLYGNTAANRLMLHAESLKFIHPGNGKLMKFNSPVPF